MKQLKYLGYGLIGALALTAVTAQANAADVYRREEGGLKDAPPVDYLPPIMWGGFYIGANLGAAFDNLDDNDTVLIGGGHLGYNWQGPRNFVVGVEGDVDFADGLDYLATIRGRLGYAFGPTLAYATGGAAFIGADDLDDTGWVAGLGLEHKLRENVSFGVEGLYYNFDDNNIDDADFWTVRARLTYHLNGYRDGGLK
jgi:outer membrane immunogenic protein